MACFTLTQGVRQGGILSSDLYKVYINPLLNNLSDSYLGMKIGNVNCNASACADDVALMSIRPVILADIHFCYLHFLCMFLQLAKQNLRVVIL
jgi:hypothetical protein